MLLKEFLFQPIALLLRKLFLRYRVKHFCKNIGFFKIQITVSGRAFIEGGLAGFVKCAVIIQQKDRNFLDY
jgi:hypothetical protein